MSAHDAHHGDHHDWPVEQEPDVLPNRAISMVLLVTIVISLACGFIAWLILESREAVLRPSGNWVEMTYGKPGEGRSEVLAIEQSLFRGEIVPGETLRLLQRKIQSSYGWADEKQELVHIPVERAMELYLKGQGR